MTAPGATAVRTRPAAGFTLLELMVVLVLMGLITGVAMPMIANILPGHQLKAAARDLLTGLSQARAQAVLQRREVALTVDLQHHDFQVGGDGRVHPIAPKIDIALFVADAAPDGRSGAFVFYPDGSSSGGRVTVAEHGRRYRIDVDWLTGLARLQD